MVSVKLRAAAALLLLLPASLAARPAIAPADLQRHVEVLASDAFEGRGPGTPGETRTIAYIADRFQKLGLEPAGEAGGWFQPVPLVERAPYAHRALWSGKGALIVTGAEDIVLTGAEASESIADAPVVFAGYGLPAQLAGADLRGAAVLLLYDTPDGPSYAERVGAAVDAGAAAVIGILDEDASWRAVVQSSAKGQTRLASERRARIGGLVPRQLGARLVEAGGATLGAGRDPSFRPLPLALKASLDVSTRLRPFSSHNVVGRLKGSGATGESLLYLGHWDHLGICRPDDAEDRICNGAVDNASGIAALIEVGRALAAGPRPKRDILFLATTAEEMGLLGAEYFAAHPVVPLPSLVAAINLDTVAVAPAGKPVAIIGRGTTPIDPIVDATARALGRAVDPDTEANALIERQDGWALARAGVPTVMVGGSFADMDRLGGFLSGPYHQPGDDLARPIELGGAAEDAALLVALGRKLADPRQYRPSGR